MQSNTLRAPFDMSYIRDRALKAAALQRRGYILVSGSPSDRGQGFPLPYIHDVPGLRRGQHPDEYECEWDRFKHEYDLALPGKWQPGEEVVYLLVFEGDLIKGSTPEKQTIRLLSQRLSEALPIPIKENWSEDLWKEGIEKDLIGELTFSDDCLAGYGVNATESGWTDILTTLLKEGKVEIR